MFDSRCPAARVGARWRVMASCFRGSTTGRSVCFAGHSLLGLMSLHFGTVGVRGRGGCICLIGQLRSADFVRVWG